ncbi:MAG: hypothetical protein ACPGO3_05450 [Magnetospiraceae bacterium]
MTAALEPIAQRLQKLIAMLSSDRDGEVLAAVSAIDRALDGAGATWHDLAATVTEPGRVPCRCHESENAPSPDSDHLAMAETLARFGNLNDWEGKFVSSILKTLRKKFRLSSKQKFRLEQIYNERIGDG